MTERDEDALADMVDFAADSMDLLGDLDHTDLEKDKRSRYAVIRAVEIVGEAATRISDETRERLSTLPWRQIIGMRHVVIHGYDAIKLDVVVDVVRNRMPLLIAEISKVLGDRK
jgi:uncharacterized protein with HEPN domain